MRYYKGLCALIKSIKKVNLAFPFFVMIPKNSENSFKLAVQKLGYPIIECDPIEIPRQAQDANKVENWNQTFFKLNIAQLTQFEKVVYIDADMLVLKNLDHLFSYPSISATTGGKAAHPEWIEFNSGLMVIEPSLTLFRNLVSNIDKAIARKTALNLGYGDQDVFNQCYPNWNNEPDHHLGETYNAIYCFLDAFMQQQHYRNLSQIHVLHYIGIKKIWDCSLMENLKNIYSCFRNHRPYEAYAYLLYLRYLYF